MTGPPPPDRPGPPPGRLDRAQQDRPGPPPGRLDRVPIVLLAHGSPDARHAVDIAGLRAAVQERAAGSLVAVAYLDHHGPTIADVGARLATAAAPVVLVPVLLTDAYHAGVDVPAAAARLTDASGRPVVTAAALGPDPLIGTATVELLGDPPPSRLLVYLSGGSRVAAVDDLVGDLGRALPGAVREYAFASLDDRRPLAAALERLGGPEGVVAVACVLARGVLRDRMAQRCRRSGIRLVDGVLAGTEALADLVLLRADRAMSGSGGRLGR